MSLYVQKFGGSSLATVDLIKQAAKKVASTLEQGHRVIVVVSAMLGETDRLVNLAKQFGDNSSSREWAAVVTTGEQVSASLFALQLAAIGYPSRSLNALQLGIHTTIESAKASITAIEVDALLDMLPTHVPVLTGFQGVNIDLDMTTLGRGGSDLTAVAIAHAAAADECQIFTDVEGIYTADPHVVRQAKLVEQLTYEEMLEFSKLGAKVLQHKAVEYGYRYQVPVRILSLFSDMAGTVLLPFSFPRPTTTAVTGVGLRHKQAMFILTGVKQYKLASAYLRSGLKKLRIEADMYMQHRPLNISGDMDIKFAVHQDDFTRTNNFVREILAETDYKAIHVDTACSKVSLVGQGLSRHAKLASDMMKLLSEADITVKLLHSTENNISLILPSVTAELAANILHDRSITQAQPSVL